MVEADEMAAVYVEQALALVGGGQNDLGNAVAFPIEGIQDLLTRSAHGEIDIALVRTHALGGVAVQLGALIGGHVAQILVQHMQGLTALANGVGIRGGIVGDGSRALFDVHVLHEFQGFGVDQGQNLSLLLAVGDYENVFGGVIGHIVGVTQLQNRGFCHEGAVVQTVFDDDSARIVGIAQGNIDVGTVRGGALGDAVLSLCGGVQDLGVICGHRQAVGHHIRNGIGLIQGYGKAVLGADGQRAFGGMTQYAVTEILECLDGQNLL